MDGIGNQVTLRGWISSFCPPWATEGDKLQERYLLGAKHMFCGGLLDDPVHSILDRRVKAERKGRQDAQATIEGGVLTVLCDCCMQPFPVFNRRDEE